jgi:tetratricopeptide (TPR) repeat protein
MKRKHGIALLVAGFALAASLAAGCGAHTSGKMAGRTEAREKESRDEQRVPLIPEAYHYYTAGNLLAAEGQDTLAIASYRRALAYDSDSRQIKFALAQSYAHAGRFDEAAIMAESIRPRDVELLRFLSELYARMHNFAKRLAVHEEWAALDSTNAGLWQLLVSSYTAAHDTAAQTRALEHLARLSGDPLVYEQLGFLKLDLGEANAAESLFQQAIASDSSQRATRVRLGLAQIWSDRNNPDSAYAYFRPAVEMNYYNVDLRKRFVYFLMQSGKRDEAIENARLVLKMSASEPDILYRLGILEFDADQLDSAEIHLTQLVTEHADHSLARYFLGRVADERGDSATAEAQYWQSIALADTLPEPYLSLGFHYTQRKHYDSAIQLYRRALERVPEQENLLFGLGAALERNGQFDESVDVFEKLIAKAPDHAPALNYLGYSLADKGVRLDDALEFIERALKVQPDNGAYLDSYAWVLFRLGRTEEAEEKLREALKYIKNDAIVYEHYGDILADLGKMQEAEENWRRALELEPGKASLQEKLNR